MVSPQGKSGEVNPTPILFFSSCNFALQLTGSATSKRVLHIRASSTPPTDEETKSCSFRERNPKDVNVLVVGSIGYIGKFVVKELVKRGFNVIAIAKVQSGIRGRDIKEETLKQLRGAIFLFSDVTKIDSLENSLESIGSL
ncbi:hypothetical protein Syun_019492 [Stephania yunnanensis]|uniref:NAD-dependent epimerase/dehydratase domain-containing protein n=1 Tax=Stephania yunnanensis TaxID=152371 RepID=A0AAP0IVE7_9MAGN